MTFPQQFRRGSLENQKANSTNRPMTDFILPVFTSKMYNIISKVQSLDYLLNHLGVVAEIVERVFTPSHLTLELSGTALFALGKSFYEVTELEEVTRYSWVKGKDYTNTT